MSGDSDAIEIEASFERAALSIQLLHLIDREAGVEWSVDRILRIEDCAAHGLHAFPLFGGFPHRVVAADGLEMDRDGTVACPVSAQILVAVASSAEAVREDDHGKRAVATFRGVNLRRNIA